MTVRGAASTRIVSPDHVGRLIEIALPRVVADDDGPGLLLLDDIGEVVQPVRASEDRRDAGNRQPVHLDRRLRDPYGLAGSRERDWNLGRLVETDRLERLAALQERLDDVVGRGLLAGVGTRARDHDEAVLARKAEVVVRHLAEQAVHDGRRPDAETQRQGSDCDDRRAARPKAEGETNVGQIGHDLLPGRDIGRRAA